MIRSLLNRRLTSTVFNPSAASLIHERFLPSLTQQSKRFAHHDHHSSNGSNSVVSDSSWIRPVDPQTGIPKFDEETTAKLFKIQTDYERAAETDPKLKHEREWHEWYNARDFMITMGVFAFGCWLIPYLMHEEYQHMLHDESEAEAEGLPYIFPRKGRIGAGWWPGRHCQLFDGNCFQHVYAEADRMLKELEEGKTPEHN